MHKVLIMLNFRHLNTNACIKRCSKSKISEKNVKKISHYELIKKLEMSYDMHIKLIKYCKLKKIKFLSSPFCIDSFNLLKKFNLDFIKIPSGEITNLPLLKHIKNLITILFCLQVCQI